VRFVADESCDFAIVRALREAGHDVIAIAEIFPQATDEYILEMSREASRILVTEDKDFGELVYAATLETSGVILLRFPGDARSSMAKALVRAVQSLSDRLTSGFVVVELGRIRIGGKSPKVDLSRITSVSRIPASDLTIQQ
jgi:predicted nuclease of predicted toxin-antitoxin system